MIDPRNMSLRDWTDSMTLELEVDGSVPRLDDIDWRGWATAVSRLSVPNQQDAPDPFSYAQEDWREWAVRFSQYLGANS